MMSTIPKTLLPTPVQVTTGERLPAFALQSATGETIRHNQYRGRANLALIFLPEHPRPSDEAYLRDVATAMSEIEEADSCVLVVTTLPADEAKALAARAGLNAPILLDPDRGAYRVYGLTAENNAQAGVVVADRYLNIWALAAGNSLPEAMRVPDMLEWLRFIAFQCSECADVTSWARPGM